MNLKTRQLCLDAVLAAMCAVLGAVSLDLGNMKFSFESLPVLIGAFLFGPLDGLLIGGVGTLLYQLLRYGVTVTTPLWIMPYMLCGLFVGWYAKKRPSLTKGQMSFAIFAAGILIFVLNTFVLYVDSKVYGYYSYVYIFGTIIPRTVICLVKVAAFSAVMPMLLNVARRVIRQ